MSRKDDVTTFVSEKLGTAKQVFDSFEATKNLPAERIETRKQLNEKVLSTNPRAISLAGVRRAVALLGAISKDQAKDVLSKLSAAAASTKRSAKLQPPP